MKATRILMGALLSGSLLCAGVAASVAQNETTGSAARAINKRVDLNLENADLRHALKLIFNAVGVNYTLDPEVRGTVTASITNIPFRTALETVLKAAASAGRFTYRVENDIYHVTVRQEPSVLPEKEQEPEPPAEKKGRLEKIHLNFIDAADLAQVLGGTVIQTRWGVNAVLLGFGNGFGQGGFGGNQGNFGMGQGGFNQGGIGQFGNGSNQFGNGGLGNGFGPGAGSGFGPGAGSGFGPGSGSSGPGGGNLPGGGNRRGGSGGGAIGRGSGGRP